jgi:hypothetical protein
MNQIERNQTEIINCVRTRFNTVAHQYLLQHYNMPHYLI